MRTLGSFGDGWAAGLCVIALALSGAGCSSDLGRGELDEASGEGNVAESVESILWQDPRDPAPKDYLFFLTPMTWAAAQATCRSVLLQNYTLAAANNADEEAFLEAEELGHGGGGWWVAITDQVKEGTFTDGINGPQAFFTNWHQGEPNNQNNEDCVIDNSFPDGKWNDYPCNRTAKFVCEGSSAIGNRIDLLQPYSAVNTNSALNIDRSVHIPIVLREGRTMTAGTCGTSGAVSSGDTFLRLFDPRGHEVAINDDACGGRGSNFSYVPSTTGVFLLRAGCYANDECSGTVAVALQPPP